MTGPSARIVRFLSVTIVAISMMRFFSTSKPVISKSIQTKFVSFIGFLSTILLHKSHLPLDVILTSFFSYVILAGCKDPVAMDGNIVNLDPLREDDVAKEILTSLHSLR